MIFCAALTERRPASKMIARDNFSSLQYATESSPSLARRNNSLYRDDEVVADYFKVLKWSLIPILCFTAVWLFEINILESSHRFISNPAEFATRVFGFSHFTVGLMFMMSSQKMRKLKGWVWFAGLLAVSGMISIFFYNLGGRANPVMVIFYFLFFMVHGFRDQVHFYKPSTSDPELERTRSRILRLTQACLLLTLMYVLVPAFLFLRSLKPKSYAPDLEIKIQTMMPYLRGVLIFSWLALPVCGVMLRQHLRKFPGGLRGFSSDNKPILLVLLYSTLSVLAAPVLGAWVFNFLILTHFVGWYFYASRQLATRPKQSTRTDNLWTWLRGSVAGFQRLHLGVAAAFLIVILINHFVRTDTGIVNTLLGANAFYYWTVIHVTISFAPKS